MAIWGDDSICFSWFSLYDLNVRKVVLLLGGFVMDFKCPRINMKGFLSFFASCGMITTQSTSGDRMAYTGVDKRLRLDLCGMFSPCDVVSIGCPDMSRRVFVRWYSGANPSKQPMVDWRGRVKLPKHLSYLRGVSGFIYFHNGGAVFVPEILM